MGGAGLRDRGAAGRDRSGAGLHGGSRDQPAAVVRRAPGLDWDRIRQQGAAAESLRTSDEVG